MSLVVLFILIALFILAVTQLIYGGRMQVPGGVIVLGIGFPKDAADSEEVQMLRARLRRNNLALIAVGVLLLLPMLALRDMFSLVFVYWWVWLVVFLTAGYKLFAASHRSASQIKQAKGWSLGERRVVRADTTLILQKSRLTVSPGWFAVPLLVSLAAICYAVRGSQDTGTYLAVQAAGVTLLLFLVSLAIRRMRTRAYSADSAINAALNRAQRRTWSFLFLGLALLDAIFAAFAVWTGLQEAAYLDTVWYIVLGIQIAVPFAGAAYTDHQAKKWQLELEKSAEQPFITDDDEYWVNGLWYYNPDDRSMMVPKRGGIGLTLNMASRGGRLFMGITAAFVVLLIAGISIFTVREDWMKPAMSINANGEVRVESPSYGYSFSLDQVQDIALADTLPSGRRVNGVSTDTYARGHFKLKEWGTARLYVYKDSPPYIVIRLTDQTVVFNYKDKEATLRLFEDLKEKRGPVGK
ncbi:hypothetical protein KIH86_15880 [Paenibacillus sp. HN-1]|uniref:DUF5808 domain-containing protein n=1 Tax=Paenibacillus TaxID=44249 RepID=UPI001CA8D244|nr:MULTISPECIES: DUF5808 domain-containing protein [Paenibacillus]MBY9079399.1 hypothetical protein [Paenibacillus sp. CGMCC 1.18879]MBY9085694.1 hypothetical protein [Paenibacillus sinensis]